MKKIVYIVLAVNIFCAMQISAQQPTTEFGESISYGEMFGYDDLFETEQLLGLEEVYTGNQTPKEKDVFQLKEFYTDVVDMNADFSSFLYKEDYFEEHLDINRAVEGNGQGEGNPIGSGVAMLCAAALAYASLLFICRKSKRKSKNDLCVE